MIFFPDILFVFDDKNNSVDILLILLQQCHAGT